MKLTSIFRHPEGGVYGGIGTAAAIYLIYQASLPPTADVRMGAPNDDNIEAARKGAAYKSAALLGVVFLITRDLNTFVIGGTALGGIDYLYKHHNAINPNTGKLDAGGSQNVAPSNVFSLPDYGQSEAM